MVNYKPSTDYIGVARSAKAEELSHTPFLIEARWYPDDEIRYKACVHAKLVGNHRFGLFVNGDDVQWYIHQAKKGWDEDPRPTVTSADLEYTNSIPIENANILTLGACIIEECKRLGIELPEPV